MLIEVPDDIPITEVGVFASRTGCKLQLTPEHNIQLTPDPKIEDRPSHFRRVRCECRRLVSRRG